MTEYLEMGFVLPRAGEVGRRISSSSYRQKVTAVDDDDHVIGAKPPTHRYTASRLEPRAPERPSTCRRLTEDNGLFCSL